MLIHTRPLLSITHIPQTYTQREGGVRGLIYSAVQSITRTRRRKKNNVLEYVESVKKREAQTSRLQCNLCDFSS